MRSPIRPRPNDPTVLLHHLDKPITELKVAVVTPTFNRATYLGQSFRYFANQIHPFAETRWFVLDDSAERSSHSFSLDQAGVEYRWLSSRMPLGEKRNELNRMARAWGADIICSMDDDDWYGPSYLQDMAALLLEHDECFVGSGGDYYYDVRNGRILFVYAVRPHTSCNGVLCYKAHVLRERGYDGKLHSAEERSFIGRDKILQHPDIKRVHLALASAHNTVSKRNYLIDPRCRTTLSLDDLPMDEADKRFYRALTAAAAAAG
jgi:glycosyltransferase involved in cell wall biosynthesis